MKRSLAVLLCLCAATVVGRAEIVEQVIVKVNGEIFTKTDLEQRQIAALRARNNRAVTPLDLENDAQLKSALTDVTPRLVVDAVDELLIMQQGKERGYHLSDEQFKGIVERIRKENKLEDDERFQAALKQEGLSMADLRKSMERQMVVSRVQSDAVGRIQVTEEEARQYYAAHQGEFANPSSITLRELLVEVVGAGSGQQTFNVGADEAAQIEARRLHARAVAGDDFAKLAADYSAAASKANGGLIGPLSRDELAPALQTVIDPLKPGQVTDIIRTPRGYQFFKLESATPSTVKPFEQAREDIVNKIYNERRAAEFRKYLQKLRAQAIIEWKNDDLRRMYEQALSSEASTGSAQ
jgi:peptidyl-prolyl cis-trans isomerase SurA